MQAQLFQHAFKIIFDSSLWILCLLTYAVENKGSA